MTASSWILVGIALQTLVTMTVVAVRPNWLFPNRFNRVSAEAWRKGYTDGWNEAKHTEESEHEHWHPRNPYDR